MYRVFSNVEMTPGKKGKRVIDPWLDRWDRGHERVKYEDLRSKHVASERRVRAGLLLEDFRLHVMKFLFFQDVLEHFERFLRLEVYAPQEGEHGENKGENESEEGPREAYL